MAEVRVTKHGRLRTKDRTGLRKKIAERNAEKAFQFGLTHGETTGNLNKYLTSLYFKNKAANNLRVYHRFVYVFHDKLLITVLPLPRDLCKVADKLEKRKEGGLL